MDMNDIKKIVIPEGEVLSIKDPNGLFGTLRTIWEKYRFEEEWSGNTKYGTGGIDIPQAQTSYEETLFNVPFQEGMKIKVTYTMDAGTSSGTGLDGTVFVPSDKTSPYTVTIDSSTAMPYTILKSYAYNSYTNQHHNTELRYSKNTGNVYIHIDRNQGTYQEEFNWSYIIITKIEVLTYEYLYRQLEYVETNGAGIDTGIQASTNGTLIYTRFMPYEANANGQYRVISNYTSGATDTRKYAVLIHGAGPYIKNVIGGNWGNESTELAQVNTLYTVTSSMSYNNRYIEVNGNRVALTSVTNDNGSSGNNYGYGLTIEGGNLVNTSKFIGRLYGFRYGTESSLGVGQWFIPVQRKSDGKVGFAKFTKQSIGTTWTFDSFIPSGSSVDFVAGPTKTEDFDVDSTTSPAPF